MLGAIDQLDDASARFFATSAVDANERAVTDTANFVWPRSPWCDDVNNRCRAVGFLVPFGRTRQQLAVGIATGDVGENDRRQGAGMMQPFAASVYLAVVGKLAEHAVQRGPIGIFGAEGARDLSHADLAAAFADEGDKFFA